METQAVDDAAHGMFPDAEVDVPAGPVFCREEPLALHFRFVGRPQVGAAAGKGRDPVRQQLEHRAGSGPGGHTVRILEGTHQFLQIQVHFPVQPVGQFLGQFRIGFAVGFHQFVPVFLIFPALGQFGVEMGLHFFRYHKGLAAVPAGGFLGLCHVFRTQGFPVGTGHVLPGTAEPDMGLHDDQGRFLRFLFGGFDGFGQGFHIFRRSHPQDLPAIGFEPGSHIFPESDVRAAFNGDLVVIIQEDQFAQPQGPCQGSGFGSHPFHLVPVGGDAVGVMVHHFVPISVVPGSHHFFRHGQTHSHGKAVAQRTRGHIHPGGHAVFRMARSLAAPLPEVLQVFQGEVIACQMEHGIKQGTAMARRQDKPVPVEPVGVFRIVFHEPVPDGVHQGCGSQRQSRVAGIGRLHLIDGQKTQGVDAFSINILHEKNPSIPDIKNANYSHSF